MKAKNTNYTIVDHLIVQGTFEFEGDYASLLKSFVKDSNWLTTRTNKRETVYARRFVCVELIRVTEMSFDSIGSLLGGFDHATVSYHRSQHEALTEVKDKLYRYICRDMKERINDYRKQFTKRQTT